MREFWKAIASVQDKLMVFYENIQGIFDRLNRLERAVEKHTETMNQIREVCELDDPKTPERSKPPKNYRPFE